MYFLIHMKVYAIRSQTTSQGHGKTFKYMCYYRPPFVYFLSVPNAIYYTTVWVEEAEKSLNPSVVHMVQSATQKLYGDLFPSFHI